MVHLKMFWPSVMACALLGCHQPDASRSTLAERLDRFPDSAAGRARQVVSGHYALYANDVRSAKKLQLWLDAEFAELESRYGVSIAGEGLVFALEQDDDPAPTITEWRESDLNSPYPGEAAGTPSVRRFHSSHGRPYCLGRQPYFWESFELPVTVAGRIGIIGELPSTPAWICFLATDRYVETSFDTTLRRAQKRRAKRIREKVSLETRLLSAPAVLIMQGFADLFMFPRWRKIDTALMNLQRSESLERALINCTMHEARACEETLSALRDRTDEAWNTIWSRRPRD